MKRKMTDRSESLSQGLSREDEERLLTGKMPDGVGLEGLVSAVEALRSVGETVPGQVEADRFATEAALLVAARSHKPSQVPVAAGAVTGRRRRLRPALVGSLAALVLLLSVSTGVAYASNDAAPGDILYGLDQALESIGLWDGGLQERLQEATKLCERGEVERGLNHAAKAVQNQAGLDASGVANGALVQAADAVQVFDQGESEQIRAQAKELLQWMATTETEGEEFGRGVTQRAQAISGKVEQGQDEAGPGSNGAGSGDNGGGGPH